MERMRHFIIALLVLIAGPVLAQDHGSKGGINWLSIAEMQQAVKKAPRPVIMDVYTEWCGPCKMLAAKTFTDPKLVEYVNKNFYAVKFNAESGDPVEFKGQKFENPQYDPARVSGRNGTHQFTQAIANVNGRIAYPTIVYLDKDLNVLAPVQGYMTPQQIEPILKYFGGNTYKTVEYPAYQTSFKGEW
ncbi:MAG: thioredoxin fold domain-containing protein [Flavobacteriales bacterium]|nr:thioredoxin fold domain-containing protein [Flavobacteriales bacterium]